MQSYTTYIEVDLDAIAHNVRTARQFVDPAQVMAVVKANAYGHGAVEVAKTALENGASWLGVARVIEGAQLRQAGITAPILVMSYAVPLEMQVAVVFDLTMTVTELEVAEALSTYASRLHRSAKVHVKVDTGMGRYGLLPKEVVGFLNEIRKLPNLEIQGLYTHFSTADDPNKTYTQKQFEVFKKVAVAVEKGGYQMPMYHAANSAATMYHPETHLDIVRLGVAMYGLRPNAAVAPAFEIRPALTFKSHVARVRVLPKGASLGYGRTYVTPAEMPIALVPVGYGDGYHRMLSNRGAVLINGRRAPIVGRVSMDQIMLDVSGVGDVQAGDEVVVMGRQGREHITAEEIGAWGDTINYEVTTGLLPRVPRFYEPAKS